MEEKKRKDSWTVEDDKVLADTVLTFIREGKTQIHAFEESATILGRTKQACGFRWNKTLRKQYNIQKVSKTRTNVVHSHIQQAMTSYDDLAKAYEDLKKDYEQLLRTPGGKGLAFKWKRAFKVDALFMFVSDIFQIISSTKIGYLC